MDRFFDFQENLASLSKEIELCIETDAWDDLNALLEVRQGLIKELFNESLPNQHLELAKQLAHSIIEQDAVFISKIRQQQQSLLDVQSSFAQGRRAVKAYLT